MTEAERFLFEKLNPPRQNKLAEEAVVAAPVTRRSSGLGFLKYPTFNTHRIFWSIAFIVVLFLFDVFIKQMSGYFEMINHTPCDDDLSALCFTMLTPVLFWIPVLYLAQWAWSIKTFKVTGVVATIWMVAIQLFRLFTLINLRWIKPQGIVIGVLVFLIGTLGIVAISWYLIKNYFKGKASCNAEPEMRRKVTTYSLQFKCPECGSRVSTTVTSLSETIRCSTCMHEYPVCSAVATLKEPLLAQIARAALYIMGGLVVVGIVFNVISEFEPHTYYHRSSFNTGSVVAVVMMLWETFGVASLIKKGKCSSRWWTIAAAVFFLFSGIACGGEVLIFNGTLGAVYAVITIFLFTPSIRRWFMLKGIAHIDEGKEAQ